MAQSKRTFGVREGVFVLLLLVLISPLICLLLNVLIWHSVFYASGFVNADSFEEAQLNMDCALCPDLVWLSRRAVFRMTHGDVKECEEDLQRLIHNGHKDTWVQIMQAQCDGASGDIASGKAILELLSRSHLTDDETLLQHALASESFALNDMALSDLDKITKHSHHGDPDVPRLGELIRQRILFNEHIEQISSSMKSTRVEAISMAWKPAMHVFVDCNLNGRQTERTIIDTGSNSTLVGPEIARRCNVRVDQSRTYAGDNHGERFDYHMGKIDSLSLGSLTITDVPCIVPARNIPGNDFEALIGNDVLSSFCVTFDFPHNMLELRGKKFPPPAAKHCFARAPLIPFGRHFRFRTVLNAKIKALGEFDSGASAVIVPANLLTRDDIFDFDGFVATLGKSLLEVKHQTLSSLSIGQAKLLQVPAQLKNTHGTTVSIGNDVLADYRVTVDYPRQELRLERP